MLTLAAVIVFVPTNDGDTGPDLRLALNMMLIAIARTVRDYRPNRRVYFGKPWGRRLHSPRKGGSGLRQQSLRSEQRGRGFDMKALLSRLTSPQDAPRALQRISRRPS